MPNATFSADVLACLPPTGWAITEDLIGMNLILQGTKRDSDQAFLCDLISNCMMLSMIQLHDAVYDTIE